MTAQTGDLDRGQKEGVIKDYKVKASTTIYKGAGLMVIKGTGYAIPAADTASGIFIGVALEGVDNSSGSDGDKSVRVLADGRHSFTVSGATIADVGKDVYASDDTTLLMTGQSNDVWVGKIDGAITTNTVWVDIGEKRNVLATYRQNIITEIVDVSTGETVYVPINFAGTVSRITSVLYGAIADVDAILTCSIGAVAITTGAITIAFSGSAAADIDTVVPTAANVVAQGDYIKIVANGASTNAVRATVNIEITVST